MNILVTGSKGMVGTALVRALLNVKEGKNVTRPVIKVDDIYEFDIGSSQEELDNYCTKSDFVFHLAGVNRPKPGEELMDGNLGLTSKLLDTLKKVKSKAVVMLASSIQASLVGRFEGSEYGKSKLEGEKLLFQYGRETGRRVAVYRFPNLMGHSRPNYNSAVSTFCYSVANDLPFTVNNRSTDLELLYIDDLIEGMFDLLEGRELHCDYPAMGEIVEGREYDGMTPHETPSGHYCFILPVYKVSLGEIVDMLESFKEQPRTLVMPEIQNGSFAKKLYSLYLTYLPKNKFAFDLTMNEDARGSFTEILKTSSHGQFSVNISKPGVTKGEHWHNSKWEFFVVVSGNGLIRERKIGTNEIVEFKVDGRKLRMVHMIPGWTHEIVNLSNTEDLVTLMWANEVFDREYPDTFHEDV